MSLRFDRKGSVRVRKRDRAANNNGNGNVNNGSNSEYFMSWTYRQCQFACDYLNLMDHSPGQSGDINHHHHNSLEPGSVSAMGRDMSMAMAMGPGGPVSVGQGPMLVPRNELILEPTAGTGIINTGPDMPPMPTATIGSLNRKSRNSIAVTGTGESHSLGAGIGGIGIGTGITKPITSAMPMPMSSPTKTKLQLTDVVDAEVNEELMSEDQSMSLPAPGTFSRASRFGSFHRTSGSAAAANISISTAPRMRASIAGCSRTSFSSLMSNSNSNKNSSFQYQRQSSYPDSVCSSSGSRISTASVSGTMSSRSSSYGFDFERDMDTKPVDPYRFSQATLEDTREDELDAILGELSALQMSLDQEIVNKQPSLLQVPGSNEIRDRDRDHRENHTVKTSGGGPSTNTNDNGVRTESPDNDSGFSDNASLLSSGSSLSASGSSSGSSTTSCAIKNNIPPSTVLNANELAALVSARLESVRNDITDEKAEKIREALAKMRAASVTRLYVKAFSPDGSSKALMVEESMSCGRVLALLADKNHVPLSHKWALVEHIPHLHMERIYEDHENMVENLLMWTRDSKNKIYFVERDEKYDMFVNPQRYFLESRLSHGAPSMDEHTKNSLIDEFFNQGVGVPDVESTLYLKAEGKKAWKKFIFVLRASGIYYYPKGRLHANSSKDLVCLATLDPNQQAYQGIGWKKKFKSPTEFGFVLKPSRLQVKSHRHMKYLCAEDGETLKLWMVGLRIAKNKRQIWDNYRSLLEDIAHEDLDRFGRSVSLASMPIQINTKEAEQCMKMISMQPQNNGEQNIYAPSNQQHVRSTALANNNMRLENSRGQHINLVQPATPNGFTREETVGFESDCPVGGTIKRKPSTVLQPKIPLTIKTRSIVGDFINVVSSGNEGTGTLTHTLQRRRSSSGSGNSTASSNSSLSSINSQPGIIQMQQQQQAQQQQQQLQQTSVSGQLPQSVQMSMNSNNNSQHPQRPQLQFQSKPPLSTPPMRKATPANPSPLVEETDFESSLDFENLPPPPPELLLCGADTVDSSNSHNNHNQSEAMSNNKTTMMMSTSFNEYGMGNAPPPPPPLSNAPPPPPPPAPAPAPAMSTPYARSINSTNNSNSSTLPGSGNSGRDRDKKKGVTFASELTQRLQSRKNNLNSISNNSDNNSSVLNSQNQIQNQQHYNQGKFSSLPPPPLNRSNSNSKSSSKSNTNSSNNNSGIVTPPKKLDDPPQDFLSDLQRVMQKKWQVAQKCHTDRNTNPQEILGFRMPDVGEESSEGQLILQQQQQVTMMMMGGDSVTNLSTISNSHPGTPNSASVNNASNSNLTPNSSGPNTPNQIQNGAGSSGGEQITENSLNNVRAWVSQHYGNSADELPTLQMQQIVGAAANIVAQQQLQKQQQLQQQQQQQQQFPPPPSPQQMHPIHYQVPASPTQKPIPPMKPIRTESMLSMTGLPPPPSPADMDSALAHGHHNVYGHGLGLGHSQGQNVIYGHTHIMQTHRNQNDMLPPPPPQSQLQNHQMSPGNGGVVIYENFQGRKNSSANNMMMGQYSAVQLRNKKPPPPIPKRAESTHLSAHIVFN